MPWVEYTAMGEKCRSYTCDWLNCISDALPNSNYCRHHQHAVDQPLATKPEVPHYQATKHEPIDVIHEWQKTVPAEIRFEFGCMVKYLGRLGKKESATVKEDLEKIKNYAEFALQRLGKE